MTDQEYINYLCKKIENIFKIKPYTPEDKEYIGFYIGRRLLLDIILEEFLKDDTLRKQGNLLQRLAKSDLKAQKEWARIKRKKK